MKLFKFPKKQRKPAIFGAGFRFIYNTDTPNRPFIRKENVDGGDDATMLLSFYFFICLRRKYIHSFFKTKDFLYLFR